jgi:hypothetical protein
VVFDIGADNLVSQRVAAANSGREIGHRPNGDGTTTIWFECPTASAGDRVFDDS